MPVYLYTPAYDRLFQAGWVINPFSGTIYEKLDEGPGWDAESIDHSVHAAGNDGTIFEVAFPDVSPTADALGYFGVVRVYGARLAMRASQQEANSLITCKLAIFGSFGSGIPATPVDNSIIYSNGTPSEQSLVGPGFLESIELWHTPWSLKKNDGTDWTPGDLNSAVAQVSANGAVRCYTIWMDVDMRLQAVTMAGVPAYPNQPVGMFQPISWRFNNAGEGIQKKYQVRIFTAAQYAAGGAGVNTDTKACTYDSGIINSSKGYHDFTTKIGSKRIRGIANGTWTVAIRTAKDWKGSDWWSDFFVQTMVVGEPGTTTLTAPTAGQVFTVSRPTFTATTTIATADRRGSEWRVYATPVGGFPEDFDPDLTDVEPVWIGNVSGDALSVRPDRDDSLYNGSYRLYVRFQEVDFQDYTAWTYNDFTINYTPQTAPTLTVTPNTTLGAVDYVLDWKADDIQHEVYGITLTRKSTDNEDTLVRLDTPDIDTGLLNDSVYIPGTSFHNLYRANSATFHTSQIDITVQCRPPDWSSHSTVALFSRWDTLAGNYRSYLFLLRSDNKLELRWSTDGTNAGAVTQVSTVALPTFPNGEFRYLRAKLNPASLYTVTFQYSSDELTWTTLGSVITGAGATSVFDTGSNRFLEVGSSDGGLGNLGPIYVRQWRLRTAIDAGTDKIYVKSHDNLGSLANGFLYNGLGTVLHWHIEGTDYEIPFNKSTTYEARSKILDENNNEWQWSGITTQGPVTISKNQTWLVACDSPALSRRFLTAEGQQSWESAKVRSSARALGRALPIVQKAFGKGDTFTFGFTVIGEQAVEDLYAILESGSKLLLKTPKQMWYVEIAGPYQTRSRIYDSRYGDEDTRTIDVPFIQVGAY